MAKKLDLCVIDFEKSNIHIFKTTREHLTDEDVKALGYGFSNNIKFIVCEDMTIIKHGGVIE